MHKSQHINENNNNLPTHNQKKIKKQNNTSPSPNINLIIMTLLQSQGRTFKEFKRMITIMIKQLKKDKDKEMNVIKE